MTDWHVTREENSQLLNFRNYFVTITLTLEKSSFERLISLKAVDLDNELVVICENRN